MPRTSPVRSRRPPGLLFLLLASAIAATACSRESDAFEPVPFDTALRAAEAAGKIVLVDFFTTWCEPCKRLDETTWRDADVRAWLRENAVAIKVDAEEQRDLAERFAVGAYPTILFLRPSGEAFDRIVGYRDAATFLDEAKLALAGVDVVARANEGVDDAPNDPMARMALARALAQKGQKQEALAEYLWCFDHGNEHLPGFEGARLTFLVMEIATLGRDFPPAIEALKERRAAAARSTGASDAETARLARIEVEYIDKMLALVGVKLE